jgi:N-acetylmuramic acid 6-phosphate etherase
MKARTTEQDSNYRHLESMPIEDILHHINHEDKLVPEAVAVVLPQLASLIKAIVEKMRLGGRLFYLGAGTSGRLGLVDAAECPPTFGIDPSMVVGVIAGGNLAMFDAVEFAEDDPMQAWNELSAHAICQGDVVVGISASGTTPYVMGGLKKCRELGIVTGSITCNYDSPISQYANFPIEVVVGPEFITGSTRMKCGTAQKLILNMISTAVMIQLGRVEDNKMVHMQLTNIKLIERAVDMLMNVIPIESREQAKQMLLKHGSVSNAIVAFNQTKG